MGAKLGLACRAHARFPPLTALLACIAASTFISLLFKLFGRYGVRNLPAIVVNYGVCVVMGALWEGEWLLTADVLEQSWLYLALGLGVFFIAGFNLNATSVQRAGIAVTSVVQRISLLISVAFAVLYLRDPLSLKQGVGIALGVLSVFLVVRAPAASVGKEGLTPKPVQRPSRAEWLLPLGVFLVAGAIESGLLLAQRRYGAGDSASYTVALFAWAGFLGLVVRLLRPPADGSPRFTRADVIGGIALGVPNFFSIYLIIVALEGGLPAATVFPVLNVATIVLGALAAVLFFGERLSGRQWAGVGVAILAIGLITS